MVKTRHKQTNHVSHIGGGRDDSKRSLWITEPESDYWPALGGFKAPARHQIRPGGASGVSTIHGSLTGKKLE